MILFDKVAVLSQKFSSLILKFGKVIILDHYSSNSSFKESTATANNILNISF